MTTYTLAMNVNLPTAEDIEKIYADVNNQMDRWAMTCGAYNARYQQALEYIEDLRAEIRANQK